MICRKAYTAYDKAKCELWFEQDKNVLFRNICPLSILNDVGFLKPV